METGKKRLTLRYNTALKAQKALEEIIEILASKNFDMDETKQKIYRDSLIQRFEFTYDIFWKYLKEYFKKQGIDVTSPRMTFEECKTQKITSEKETEILLSMVSDRNLTTHLYSEITADRISSRIYHYYDLIRTILKKTKPE